MMQMENIEVILEDSDIVGTCPETGIEANMKYEGRTKIRNPEIKINYNLRCSVCNNQHYLHKIENLRLKRKGKY